MAVLAATVWFIPGWLRTAEPHEGILECVSNAFPEASVEFKAWDGDNLVWPLSVDSADKESWRFAFEVAMMTPLGAGSASPLRGAPSGTATPAPKGSVAERRNLRLKPALQAQTKSAIIPTTSKKASSAQGYATSVALATG